MIYELKGTERVEVAIEKVDCGEAKITRYFDEQNVMVRQDMQIIVDAETLAKLQGRTGDL